MTHAFAMIPNFFVPLGADERAQIPFHADPILAAIDAHNDAWSAFQVASQGEPSTRAEADHDNTLVALLGTACTTRPGAFCLLRHLRWLLCEEAANADSYGPFWPVVQAREADLTLLLGCDGIDRFVRIAPALPSGRLPAPHVVPYPTPARATDHTGRFLQVGEAIGSLALVIGGAWLTALATLV